MRQEGKRGKMCKCANVKKKNKNIIQKIHEVAFTTTTTTTTTTSSFLPSLWTLIKVTLGRDPRHPYSDLRDPLVRQEASFPWWRRKSYNTAAMQSCRPSGWTEGPAPRVSLPRLIDILERRDKGTVFGEIKAGGWGG